MRRAVSFTLALTVALSAGAATAAPGSIANAPGRFAPRDECANALGAAAFRANLARAVARRDAVGLAALADPEVSLDFGGGAGPAELRRRLSGPQGRELWRELDEILRLGCAMRDGGMTFPWFFAQDLGDLDSYTTLLVAAPNVPLRAAAAPRARVVRMLSWQLVSSVGEYDPSRRFTQVEVVGTRQRGYVESARLRSQIGYRLGAERRRGAWRIAYFTAGD